MFSLNDKIHKLKSTRLSLHLHTTTIKLNFQAAVKTEKFSVLATIRNWPIMLIFYLLCYAAVLIKLTYYAQNYA